MLFNYLLLRLNLNFLLFVLLNIIIFYLNLIFINLLLFFYIMRNSSLVVSRTTIDPTKFLLRIPTSRHWRMRLFLQNSFHNLLLHLTVLPRTLLIQEPHFDFPHLRRFFHQFFLLTALNSELHLLSDNIVINYRYESTRL